MSAPPTASFTFETMFLASHGARNWPFFTCSRPPVAWIARAEATTRSVWRQRKAGICSRSTTCAKGSAWEISWMSVAIGTLNSAFTFARILKPSSSPGPR